MSKYESFNFEETVPHLRAGRPVSGISLFTKTSRAWVYRLRQDGRPCILRISAPDAERDEDDEQTPSEDLRDRIEALKRGKSLECFEQLIQYSVRHEAVLTHQAPGKPLPGLTIPEVRTITPAYLEATAMAIGRGVVRRIVPDPHPTNMIFHPKHGITIIDYECTNSDNPSAQGEYVQFLGSLGGAIVAPVDSARYRSAWSRVFEDGLTVLHQTFGVEPAMIPPELAFYRSDLRG